MRYGVDSATRTYEYTLFSFWLGAFDTGFQRTIRTDPDNYIITDILYVWYIILLVVTSTTAILFF